MADSEKDQPELASPGSLDLDLSDLTDAVQGTDSEEDAAEGISVPPLSAIPAEGGASDSESPGRASTVMGEREALPPEPGSDFAAQSDATNSVSQASQDSTSSDEDASDSIVDPEAGDAPDDDGDDSHLRRKRRRKRKVLLPETGSSAEAAMHRKELASPGELKRLQRAGIKRHGQKVVADDVNKLKSLSVTPQLEGEFSDHYIEPVRIEYYIPKESRFVTETRYLYVPLIDPEPRTDPDDAVLRDHIEAEKFVDLLQVLGDYPQYTTLILDSYHETFHMYESLSRTMKDARADPEKYRTALYMVETLGQHEPTLAALEALGEFQSWNLNWLIRTMNERGIEFACADYTISYLIKRRNEYWEQSEMPFDERFEILASLFFDQAFPNRGLHIGEEDYFFDIFDKKNFIS